jgi:hypothetical protein
MSLSAAFGSVPPTDFHSATSIGDYIYIIGSLGYVEDRQPGVTPVYRLETKTCHIEKLPTTGDNPGWIFRHRAEAHSADDIIVWGGEQFVMGEDGKARSLGNTLGYRLDVERLIWAICDEAAVGTRT